MDFTVILVFLLGACAGSFLNVCIYRIPRHESVVHTPSHCRDCGTRIRPWDLVPVISYLWLKGRCRYCGGRISPQYPLVELVTAALFVAAFKVWGLGWQAAAMWVFFAMLVAVAVIDIHHKIIPDEILVAGLVLGLPCVFLVSPGRLLSGVIGFFVSGFILLAIALVSRGGMGGGDVKLSAVMGLFLGWPAIIVSLFLAFLAGGLAGIFLLATGRKNRKDAVPFGPYLAAGGVAAAFYADRLINWYLGISGW